MKNKIFLLVFILFLSAYNLFSQYDLSVKGYYISGKINPSKLNNLLEKADANYENYISRTPISNCDCSERGEIDELTGYGYELSYLIYDYLGITFGYEGYNQINRKYSYHHWHGEWFPPAWTSEYYEMEIDLSTIYIIPFYTFSLNKYTTISAGLGPTLNFIKIKDILVKSYSYNDVPKKFENDNHYLRFQYSLNASIKLSENVFLDFSLLYKTNKNTFYGKFGLASYYNDTTNYGSPLGSYPLEIDASGYFLTAGLKIGIL